MCHVITTGLVCVYLARVLKSLDISEPLGQFSPSKTCFHYVHIDLVGPWLVINSFSHILTYVDHFTLWPEAIPIADNSTKTVARAFVSNWMARFGVQVHITY